MKIVRKTQKGINYLAAILREKASVVTRAVFWRITHNSGQDDLMLKIGRYQRNGYDPETLAVGSPKSELTLEDEELRNLLAFMQENYEPLRAGATKYIQIDESFAQKNVEDLKTLFRNPDKESLLRFVLDNNILPADLVLDIQHKARVDAIREFEELLDSNALEAVWQKWFSANSWVLGTEFVRVLDEREIDTQNVADYLVEAYDGFLDIVEIKRPGGGLRFWANGMDHGNYFPSSDLIKAITQSQQYIFEIEREINSQKFLERVGEVRTVKPRCVLVYGRSHDWNDDQCRSYRILSASYHNLSILTYDHVLRRAKRLLGINEEVEVPFGVPAHATYDNEIPF